MTPNYELNWAGREDYISLGQVMYAAVHDARSLYSEAQRAAWMPEPRSGAEWDARLDAQSVIMAKQAGEIVGFASVTPEGYVDFTYILPKHQGVGLFGWMLAELTGKARELGLERLSTHASLMAQGAFAKQGFKVVAHEEVELRGEAFARAEMENVLG